MSWKKTEHFKHTEFGPVKTGETIEHTDDPKPPTPSKCEICGQHFGEYDCNCPATPKAEVREVALSMENKLLREENIKLRYDWSVDIGRREAAYLALEAELVEMRKQRDLATIQRNDFEAELEQVKAEANDAWASDEKTGKLLTAANERAKGLEEHWRQACIDLEKFRELEERTHGLVEALELIEVADGYDGEGHSDSLKLSKIDRIVEEALLKYKGEGSK